MVNIIALSPETIRRAEEAVSSCEACNSDAELPFEWILDEITGCEGTRTDYFLTEPARCPRCGTNITEKTLVEGERT